MFFQAKVKHKDYNVQVFKQRADTNNKLKEDTGVVDIAIALTSTWLHKLVKSWNFIAEISVLPKSISKFKDQIICTVFDRNLSHIPILIWGSYVNPLLQLIKHPYHFRNQDESI